MKLFKFISDFWKWRKEQYEEALRTELLKITKESYSGINSESRAYYLGLFKRRH